MKGDFNDLKALTLKENENAFYIYYFTHTFN